MRIAGARALVTGASGGIGEAIARELSAQGAELLLSSRRRDRLDPVADALGADAFPCDLADTEQLDALIERAADVDILVANAGVSIRGRLKNLAVDDVDQMLDVNLRAPILLARALSTRMAERGRGHIVMISSFAGKVASADVGTVYTASKFGLRGFTLVLRAQLRDVGVGVSLVNPGPVRNAGMFANATQRPERRWLGTSTPQSAAAGVARAIERDLAEVSVGSLPMRAVARISGVAPHLVLHVSRRLPSARRFNAPKPGGGLDASTRA